MLFEIVKEFLRQTGSTPFVGQCIVMEDFKEWQKKRDEERGLDFDEVLQELINMYLSSFHSICLSLNVSSLGKL